MKLWQALDEQGNVIASVPWADVLRPHEVAKGRTGYGIYEALSASGHILYTGRTGDLRSRLRWHAANSGWWGFVSDVRWTPCDNYAETVALERVGIGLDHGAWNLNGYVSPKAPRVSLPSSAHRRLRLLYAAVDQPFGWLDFDNYVATLRHAGWTLASIAEPLAVTREAIRLRALRGAVDLDLAVPVPPSRVAKVKVWPKLRPSEVSEIRELHPLATGLRGGVPIEDERRRASERLSEIIAEARLRGVRWKEIDAALGVKHGTSQKRLARHGYMKNAPSQTKYRAKVSAREQATECKRGHALSGANLRLVNGDTSRRICRACERLRCEEYRKRQAERAMLKAGSAA